MLTVLFIILLHHLFYTKD